jgi:protein-S-isoprenylcysteine O-methyltransferase
MGIKWFPDTPNHTSKWHFNHPLTGVSDANPVTSGSLYSVFGKPILQFDISFRECPMHLPSPAILGAIFGISEIALGLLLRARSDSQSQDRGSLRILWVVILGSLFIAFQATHWLPDFNIRDTHFTYPLGVLLFFAGLLLRWFSIIYLGRFFTVNVAIAKDHRVIDTGPYRHIRHPSYTGALMAFLGFGICLSNIASILIILIPVTAAFLHRIGIEEAALGNALGDAYGDYSRRSKRLIPFIY